MAALHTLSLQTAVGEQVSVDHPPLGWLHARLSPVENGPASSPQKLPSAGPSGDRSAMMVRNLLSEQRQLKTCISHVAAVGCGDGPQAPRARFDEQRKKSAAQPTPKEWAQLQVPRQIRDIESLLQADPA